MVLVIKSIVKLITNTTKSENQASEKVIRNFVYRK